MRVVVSNIVIILLSSDAVYYKVSAKQDAVERTNSIILYAVVGTY